MLAKATSPQTVKLRPKTVGFFRTIKLEVPVEKGTAIQGNLHIALH